MCSAQIRFSTGDITRRFLECTTNADRLFYSALQEAEDQGGRLIAVEPCFYAIESAVRFSGRRPYDLED